MKAPISEVIPLAEVVQFATNLLGPTAGGMLEERNPGVGFWRFAVTAWLGRLTGHPVAFKRFTETASMPEIRLPGVKTGANVKLPVWKYRRNPFSYNDLPS